jgi:aspartyl-tRNA(Asn)/glutamyl-tRNA(Gln) amidotransferase subunit A
MELYKKSAAELSALLRSKEVTACEILDDTLARIDAVEPKVDAFLSVTADTARAKAKEVDEKIARGETLGVLACGDKGQYLYQGPENDLCLPDAGEFCAAV